MSTSIVVPMHTSDLSENELISLKQMKKVFNRRHFSIVCPRELNGEVSILFSGTQHSVLNFPLECFESTRTYNRLLTSVNFYKSFSSYSHILICQLDVYVFHDSLSKWEQSPYDFVGAPTFEGYRGGSTQFASTLNGGISLRKVTSMIRVLEQVSMRFNSIRDLYKMEKSWRLKCVRLVRDGFIYNYKTPRLHPIINEDLYWSYLVPRKHSWFSVPLPEVALTFSFDVNPHYLYKLNNSNFPMAIHAWWRYDNDFVIKLINSSRQKSP